MPASFGAVKLLQQRMGDCPRGVAKKALEAHDLDEDAAAKFIAETTEYVDSNAVSVEEKAAKKALAALGIEDDGATGGQNDTVSVVKIEEGDGSTFPAYGDTLHMHYTGTLDDGIVFDSSYDRKQEFVFRIGMGKVIKGWDEAIPKMSLGEKSLIFVPASKAYGVQGSPPTIPPMADLKFEVHLLKITRQTSCLGAGRHGGVQRDAHEYDKVAQQLLGRAPREDLELRPPDERKLMPLTSDMPRVDMLREHS